MSEAIEKQATTWCQPISDEAFCGEPSRYVEDYDTLLTELGKLESMHGEACDWNIVLRCADGLLRQKTKDMTVLGALCVSLFQKQGFAGLAAGLWAYRWLIEKHSKGMFPRASRRRGRAAAYGWLTQWMTSMLEQQEPSTADHEPLVVCSAEFEQLDALVNQELRDLHPRVRPLTELFDRYRDQTAPAPEPEPQPEEPPTPPEPMAESSEPPPPAVAPEQARPAEPPPPASEPPPPPPPTIPNEIEDEAKAEEVLGLVTKGLGVLARYHLARDLTTSLGYHFAHLASFIGVVPDGDRGLAAGSPRVMGALQEALERGDYPSVLQQFSEMMGAQPDGQLSLRTEWALSQALEGLEHPAPLATVNAAALDVYLRMGDLANLTGEPKKWLDGLVSQNVKATEPAENRATPVPPVVDPIKETIDEAAAVAKRRGLDQGCEILHGALQQTGSKPEQFRLRLALAALCVEGGAADLARPMLQDLYTELQEPIAQWERGLLVEVTTTILACNRQLQPSDESAKRELETESAKMMALLARIDPQAAFREKTRS